MKYEMRGQGRSASCAAEQRCGEEGQGGALIPIGEGTRPKCDLIVSNFAPSSPPTSHPGTQSMVRQGMEVMIRRRAFFQHLLVKLKR